MAEQRTNGSRQYLSLDRIRTVSRHASWHEGCNSLLRKPSTNSPRCCVTWQTNQGRHEATPFKREYFYAECFSTNSTCSGLPLCPAALHCWMWSTGSSTEERQRQKNRVRSAELTFDEILQMRKQRYTHSKIRVFKLSKTSLKTIVQISFGQNELSRTDTNKWYCKIR